MWLAEVRDVVDWIVSKKEKKPFVPNWQPTMVLQNEKPGLGKVMSLTPSNVKLTIPGDYHWLDNALHGTKDKKFGEKIRLNYDPRRCVFVRAMYEFGGTFLEEFELQSYPFDCQDLKIIILVKNSPKIVPIPSNIVHLSFNPNLSMLSDFRVMTVLGEYGTSLPDGSGRKNTRHGSIALVVKVKRDWKSILNILIASAVLTFLTLGVFALDPRTDLGDRLNYLMVLILTDVSLQQSAASTLSEIEYLTALDKYIWSAFLFKVAVTIWVVVPDYPILNAHLFSNVEVTNQAATFVFFFSYFLWITGAAIYFSVVRHVERRKLDKTVIEIQKEFLRAYSPFESRWNEESFASFRQDMMQNENVTRYAQFAKLDRKALGSSEKDQHLDAHSDVKAESVILETVSIRSTIMFLAAIIVTTWVLLSQTGLLRKFREDVGLIFLLNIVLSLLDMGFVIWEKRPTQYAHSLWLRFSVVAVALLTLTSENISVRAFIANVAIAIWEGINFIWDALYLRLAFFKKNMTCENDQTRLKTKHIEVHNAWEEKKLKKYKDEKRYFRIVRLWLREMMKHIGIGFVQGFRAVIVMLPVWVVQIRSFRGRLPTRHIPTGFIITDFGAFVACGLGLVGFALSVQHGDILSVIDHKRRWQTLLFDKTGDAGDLSEHSEYETMEDVDIYKGGDKCCCMTIINPFVWVRYPFRTSEFLFVTGLWLLSLPVVVRYVGGLIAVLAPLFAFMLPYILEGPLLDHAMDDAFGERISYQKYRAMTGQMFPPWH